MSSSYGPTVPEGQSPPFAVVTPVDHAAWVIIATALGLVCSLFFGGVRLLVRTTISDGFRLDDQTLAAATAFAAIQSSIVLGACAKGLGKAIVLVSPGAQEQVQRMYYASNIFFIIVIGLTKMSVVCLLSRISRLKQHKLVFNIVNGLFAAWTFSSVMAIALQCNLGHPWFSIGESCPGILLRWQIICALDIVTEVTIVGLTVYLVMPLQTTISRKAKVVAIFSFRLFIIIFIAFRLHTFDQAGYTRNPFIREAPFIAWTQSQMAYALMSATVPTFQNFLKNLNTGFGGVSAAEGGYGYGSGNHGRSKKGNLRSYQMSKLRTVNKDSAIDEADDEDMIIAQGQTTTVSTINGRPDLQQRNNGETTSISSDASRRMMIRKDVQWTIDSEPRH